MVVFDVRNVCLVVCEIGGNWVEELGWVMSDVEDIGSKMLNLEKFMYCWLFGDLNIIVLWVIFCWMFLGKYEWCVCSLYEVEVFMFFSNISNL